MSTKTLFTLALVAGLALVGSNAFADGASDAGNTVLTTIEQAITGNIGLVIGLVLAILGIWTWVVKQETAAGIMLIIGGVLITVAPGVFNTLGGIVAPIVKVAGGGDATTAHNGQTLSGE
jgi:hypothetical protein